MTRRKQGRSGRTENRLPALWEKPSNETPEARENGMPTAPEGREASHNQSKPEHAATDSIGRSLWRPSAPAEATQRV